MFTTDGKRQRLSLFSFSFLVILNKPHKKRKMSPTISHKYKYFHSTVQTAEDRRRKFHFLPFAVWCNIMLNLSNHSYDCRPNWTPLSPITIINRFLGLLSFTYKLINFKLAETTQCFLLFLKDGAYFCYWAPACSAQHARHGSSVTRALCWHWRNQLRYQVQD